MVRLKMDSKKTQMDRTRLGVSCVLDVEGKKFKQLQK